VAGFFTFFMGFFAIRAMDHPVRLLFHELADLPQAERQRLMDERQIAPELRAELESLLSFDSTGVRPLSACVSDAAEEVMNSVVGREVHNCGPYRLVRLLERGGMGAVYLGERMDGEIQQTVAVKLLRADGSRPGWRDRFLKERQLLASLNHASIVHVIDAGHTIDGRPYLVMEYVEGVSIDVHASTLEVRECLMLFLRVCEGVSHAHRRLIIHRDLKPSNILVDASGQPKVLDFGIARILDDSGDATQTVERLLTPNYASPEQLRGASQSTATDIYSLGAVLYKILTGRSPHESDTYTSQAFEVIAGLREIPAPSLLNPKLPADLDYMLRKALRLKPEERYASVDAFANDIRAFLESRPIEARSGNGWHQTRKFVRRYWVPVSADGPERARTSGIRKPTDSESLTPPIRTLLVIGASLLLVAAIAVGAWPRARGPKQTPDGRVMLAVLPFQNLTGDSTQDYVTDGLTEEMIGELGRLNPAHLGVIARTSVMHYKGSPARIGQIGRELGVQYVLEGSIREQGDLLRVSAQLIRVDDETHTWARQYDRRAKSLLALESEIAGEISDQIQLALGRPKPAPPVQHPVLSAEQSEAHDLYLHGLYFWNKRTAEDFWRAIHYFKQAIAKDSNYAAPYAGLADCYALLGGYSAEPRPEYMSKAREAALRALALDKDLAEAHTALAVIVQNWDHDWQAAGDEYRRAIALNPNYATAHQWYAEHLGYLGRFEEAFRESESARQLDPLSLIIAADNGLLLVYARQYDRAMDRCRSALEMDPNFLKVRDCLARVYLAKNMFREALAQFDQLRRTDPGTPFLWCWLAYTYGRSGQREDAGRALEKLREVSRAGQTDAAVFVLPYIGLGDNHQGLTWLERAFSQHSNTIATLKVDPVFDPLRGDPRFVELLRRAGLSPW
jgi:serine/threonine-protein kinase